MILRKIILLFLLSLCVATYGQERSFWTGNANSNFQGKQHDFRAPSDGSCLALIVVNKTTSIDTSIITPFYYSNGLYLLKNGVYNFIIKGKKYFYYRINKITEYGIYISYFFYLKNVFASSPDEEIKLKFYPLNDGLVGWPHQNMESDKYSFAIVEQNFCERW